MLFIHISSIAPVIPSRKNTWFGGEPETFILKLFFYQEEIFTLLLFVWCWSADVFLCSGAWKSVRGEQIDGGDILKIKVIIDSLQ